MKRLIVTTPDVEPNEMYVPLDVERCRYQNKNNQKKQTQNTYKFTNVTYISTFNKTISILLFFFFWTTCKYTLYGT